MRPRLLALLASPLFALPLAAQLPGYAPASAERQKAVEAAAVSVPDAARARVHSRALASEVHVAGTEAQARTRDYVIDQMKAMGLQTEVRAYDVWMPHPTNVQVWRLSPDTLVLSLQEPPVAEDPWSQLPQYPTVNGYSGSGNVTGQIIYVGYGLVEDYATLDSMGISVKGHVVLARYGRSFRGIKAREAEKHGAKALLIYSDPQDDGFVRGDVYPEGPFRNENGVQRGSVMNMNGDPSTPGWGSTRDARRIPVDSMDVPRIPVVPISWGNAAKLLEDVRGADIPPGWQGGMPFRYHVGPGPVQVRVIVENDTATNAMKTIWNTYGIIRGSEFPDEMVLIGGHRDAWSVGSSDNVSGTVSVLEAARAVADQVKAGHRPRRTMVFATWDAEEWGLIGSTEYVEEDSLRLMRGGVAYLNQDGGASGPNFGGGGSPSLREMLRDVARGVPDPSGKGNVYEVWRQSARVAADSLEPRMGDPGGGSDFAGFYNHLGIPIADWGFSGRGGGVYHSAYDTPHFQEKFGDTGYLYHATTARVGAAMMLRLANADIVPYDYVEFARTMRGYLPGIEEELTKAGVGSAASGMAALGSAIDRMETAAAAWAAARDAALASAAPARPVLERTNRALREVERALTRPEGLRTRPWFRNLIYAADENNGYANVVFPSVIEASRRKDAALTASELADLASRFEKAAAALDTARAALGS